MTTQTITDSDLFSRVRDYIDDTLLIAWDGCHKIYLALDEVEADWFRENYEHTVEESPEFMLTMLGKWWEESCLLKFISGVRHNEADPNAGFISLIGQGDWGEDEDYDDED